MACVCPSSRSPLRRRRCAAAADWLCDADWRMIAEQVMLEEEEEGEGEEGGDEEEDPLAAEQGGCQPSCAEAAIKGESAPMQLADASR